MEALSCGCDKTVVAVVTDLSSLPGAFPARATCPPYLLHYPNAIHHHAVCVLERERVCVDEEGRDCSV